MEENTKVTSGGFEELARFNSATVGRENRMIELKREVNELPVKLGQNPRHQISSEEEKP